MARDAGRDLVALPRAAVLMLWAAAYLRGDIGPDDAADLSRGADRTEDGGEGVDLFDWLTSLRRLPLAQLRLVLPVPGRLAGLVGPPPAVPAALEAEQAIVVTAAGIADHTLVPEIVPTPTVRGRVQRVSWQRFAAPAGAHVPPPASSGTAREELLRALRRAADSAVDLDLVPDEPVELARVPERWAATGLPRHLEGADSHLLVLAARTLLLVQDELADEDRTVSLGEGTARRALLAELQDASRMALVEVVERIVHAELL
ncbi:hypothetical protein ACXET9_04960 [Brachybacterium sp. DNPG3]